MLMNILFYGTLFFMTDLEIFEPLAPRYPELLEEAYGIPDRTVVAHDICNLLLSRYGYAQSAGLGITVRPGGSADLQSSFAVDVEPSGKTSIFFSPKTDFEACLPGGVIHRLDQPNKRMLTRSGKDQIITALRFGSLQGDFGARQYGGTFGIEKFIYLD